jgi:hypothetical protein
LRRRITASFGLCKGCGPPDLGHRGGVHADGNRLDEMGEARPGIFGCMPKPVDFEQRLDGAQPLDDVCAILPGDRQCAEGLIVRHGNKTEFQTDPGV